jgi:large subunit ribosomal protein L17
VRRGKLGRMSGHRTALFRNLVTSLMLHDRIQTTEAKAKNVRGLADHVVTLGKRGDLHARRQVAAIMLDPEAVKRVFDAVAPKYTAREGGYTRIIKIGPRRGDAAEEVILELV